MRRFFWAPKTYAKKYGKENIYNLFGYQNLCFTIDKYLRSRSIVFGSLVLTLLYNRQFFFFQNSKSLTVSAKDQNVCSIQRPSDATVGNFKCGKCSL